MLGERIYSYLSSLTQLSPFKKDIFMERTFNCIAKSFHADAPKGPIAVAANTPVTVLDQHFKQVELVGRYIQNVGANPCFYTFGSTCTGINYHGVLAAGQQLSINDCADWVSVFSVLGTSICSTTIANQDLRQDQGIQNPGAGMGVQGGVN